MVTISSPCAFGSNDLMFGRCLFCSSHKNPPNLGQFGNVWRNRGRELEEEGEKLCCLSTTEYRPRVGSSLCCCHRACDFGQLLETVSSEILFSEQSVFLKTLDLVLHVSGVQWDLSSLCVPVCENIYVCIAVRW